MSYQLKNVINVKEADVFSDIRLDYIISVFKNDRILSKVERRNGHKVENDKKVRPTVKRHF